MAYTTQEIIDIAKVSQFLSENEIEKSGLYGGGVDYLFPRKLYMIRKNVEWLYDLDSSDDTLVETANYLYALCGRFALKAASIILDGGSGSISPINPSTANPFPIYITDSNFVNATDYVDDRIESVNIIVYFNEINRYLEPGVETSVSGNTLTILVPGFDATVNTYNLVIEKYTPGV